MPEPFDLRSQIRDPKTGQVVKSQPYRLICEKGKPNVYERNGIRYYENGELVKSDRPIGPSIPINTLPDRFQKRGD